MEQRVATGVHPVGIMLAFERAGSRFKCSVRPGRSGVVFLKVVSLALPEMRFSGECGIDGVGAGFFEISVASRIVGCAEQFDPPVVSDQLKRFLHVGCLGLDLLQSVEGAVVILG